MRTPEELQEILTRIFQTGGLTEDMERDLKALKDELDEREGMLRRYQESADSEEPAPVETASGESLTDDTAVEGAEEDAPDYESMYKGMEAKYNELSTRYSNLLFSPSETAEDTAQLEAAEPEDPYQGLTVEQLFN